MKDDEFYNRCAEILGTQYECEPFPYRRRTRWNNRIPGSGRYPGYGLIRKFGSQIQVHLRYPVEHSKVYNTTEEVLRFLESIPR